MSDEDLTQEEKEELYKYLAATGTPVPEEKFNVHLFLNKVATTEDTTKVANLKEEELGNPRYPVRAQKSFARISSHIIGNETFADYFKGSAEDTLATSLSREGFLDKLAITTTRQFGDIGKMGAKKKNRSWFQRKEKPAEGEASE
jgi:hypothetical protein